jgi:hypothetical protein
MSDARCLSIDPRILLMRILERMLAIAWVAKHEGTVLEFWACERPNSIPFFRNPSKSSRSGALIMVWSYSGLKTHCFVHMFLLPFPSVSDERRLHKYLAAYDQPQPMKHHVGSNSCSCLPFDWRFHYSNLLPGSSESTTRPMLSRWSLAGPSSSRRDGEFYIQLSCLAHAAVA